MTSQLQLEIKQTRPFASPEEELSLNLMRTTDFVMRKPAELLKTHKLSSEQYNVLRILRGAGSNGLHCSEIGARMVTRNPDITRLLDKLERRGLVRRTRSETDRRVVTTVISADGLKLLSVLDRPVVEVLRLQLRHLSKPELRRAIRILERIRMRENCE